ncbi:hypothetical protein [Halorubrum salsamenti]|uniref:hypothetical protein n=1 Tax=Halorubrum salsamenti TaxID=2583990 RepID=UPI001F4F6B5A|nr:hypothetical protein [Halorubrum salsamenti]
MRRSVCDRIAGTDAAGALRDSVSLPGIASGRRGRRIDAERSAVAALDGWRGGFSLGRRAS